MYVETKHVQLQLQCRKALQVSEGNKCDVGRNGRPSLLLAVRLQQFPPPEGRECSVSCCVSSAEERDTAPLAAVSSEIWLPESGSARIEFLSSFFGGLEKTSCKVFRETDRKRLTLGRGRTTCTMYVCTSQECLGSRCW